MTDGEHRGRFSLLPFVALGMVFAVLGLTGFLWLTMVAAPADDLAGCRRHLQRLAVAGTGIYAAEHGALPPTTGAGWHRALWDTRTVGDPSGFLCPADHSGANRPADRARPFTAANTSYLGRTAPYPPAAEHGPLACDESAAFHGGSVVVVDTDGVTTVTPESDGDPLRRPPLAGAVGD